jgi:hypothetical protein
LIIDFEGFKSAEKFDNIVLPLLKSTNTPFSYYREDMEALVILERQPLFFVFLAYVPNGHHTHLPTLEQSMQNELGEPRESKGEWIVDTIFQCREEDAKIIFDKVEEKDDIDKIIPFIRKELYQF